MEVAIAAKINDARFPQRLRGYNIGDVDQFLADLAGRLIGGQEVNAEDLRRTRFRQTLRGYGVQEVDALLRDIELGLTGAPPPPASWP